MTYFIYWLAAVISSVGTIKDFLYKTGLEKPAFILLNEKAGFLFVK
jgi:hypothetical protein